MNFYLQKQLNILLFVFLFAFRHVSKQRHHLDILYFVNVVKSYFCHFFLLSDHQQVVSFQKLYKTKDSATV